MNRSDHLTSVNPERVELLCDRERWSEALPLVGRLLATDPENELAWCLLAQCRLGLGHYDAALTAAGQAAALAPDHEWPHRLVSFASTKLGHHDAAVRAAREAVRLEPEAWQTHVRLAAASGRAGDGHSDWDRQTRSGWTETAQAADRALALAPDEPQVQLIYGSLAAGQGRRVAAERAYRAALELDPQSSSAHHLLAVQNLHWRTGPVGLAHAANGFATALILDPTAQISRRSLELALQLFLGRAAYGLFVTAYLSLLLTVRSTLWSRVAPGLLLALVLLFAISFLQRIGPSLRTFLRRFLRHRSAATGLGLEVSCAVLVAAGTFAPQAARPALAAAAAIIALTARLAVFLGTRRLLRAEEFTKPA